MCPCVHTADLTIGRLVVGSGSVSCPARNRNHKIPDCVRVDVVNERSLGGYQHKDRLCTSVSSSKAAMAMIRKAPLSMVTRSLNQVGDDRFSEVELEGEKKNIPRRASRTRQLSQRIKVHHRQISGFI